MTLQMLVIADTIDLVLEVPPNISYTICMLDKKERMMHDCREEDMQMVRDRLEDMYWTLAPKLNEFQKDKLDDITLEYRLKIREILKED